MKRCPQCGREYDTSMMFCLDDGAELLYGPAGGSGDEPQTAILHETAPPSEAQTRSQIHSTRQPEFTNAIAVLPFANLSRSEDGEYLSDGLAEELLNVLSRIKGLRVSARTSSFAFKGKQAGVEEIGRALHVQSVLEGSVRAAGNRVRIAVQLVDVKNGFHLWSQSYDRTMNDIFAIQDDIAQSVVGELREQLIGGENDSGSRRVVAAEVAKAVKGRAADPEAQRLMLLGRYLLERQNEPDAIKAVEYLRQTLEIDPNYALAWAELGRASIFGSNNGWRSIDANFERGEESFRKALEIDPDLAEGYAGLGRIRLLKDSDFLGAQQHIKRALVLSPENADVLLAAATVSQMLGEFEKALEYCRRVIAIDPLNPSAWSATSRTHFLLGRLSEAEAAANRTLEIVPQGEKIRVLLGLILLGQGRAEEALAQAQMEDSLWRPWALAIIHDAAGRRAESDKELEDLVARYGSDAAFQRAEVHGVRGEIDQAFDWLERAVAQHDPGLVMAKISPFLKSLHNDPRWKPMLKRIGFPD